MTTRPFTVGIVQDHATSDVAANVARAAQLIREAAQRGAQIICLKELFNTTYFAKSTKIEHFDLAEPAKHYPARFMLYVVDVKPGQGDVLPAITHVDNTARLQTVHADESPLYHQLISTFGQASGVPVILNTSFNLKGEPIVTTPAEAYSTFMRSGMDALVLGHTVITKS